MVFLFLCRRQDQLTGGCLGSGRGRTRLFCVSSHTVGSRGGTGTPDQGSLPNKSPTPMSLLSSVVTPRVEPSDGVRVWEKKEICKEVVEDGKVNSRYEPLRIES